MRHFYAHYFIGFTLILCSCSPIKVDSAKKNKPVHQTYTNSLVTAPVDYIAATIQAGEKGKAVIDIAAINKAVELFEASEGQKPSSIEELVQKKYLISIPPAPVGKKIMYDPTSGKVTIVND
jgi:hypothetical protein